MTPDQEHLLLTTARILRATLRDHVEGYTLAANMSEDLRCMNEVLAPFDGSKAEREDTELNNENQAAVAPTQGPQDRMLQFFSYQHLPEHLQAVSEPFFSLAHQIVSGLPANAERTVALRKLMEAKDCAVRARLYVEPAKQS